MANNRESRGTRGRSGKNNNPDGRNQYSGLMNSARGKPLVTATAVGGAVAAGVFLWSRRNQISDQLENLADQIGGWREGRATGSDMAIEDSSPSDAFASNPGTRRSQADISEEALTLKETGKAS